MTNISHRKRFALVGQLAVLGLCLALPLAGCGAGGRLPGSGGGGASPIGRKIGSMTFRVAWPKPSRLIPVAAKAIVISVTRNGNPVVSKTIVKPADFTATTPPSTVSFDALEVGESSAVNESDRVITYTVTATAYPEDPAVASGTAQATGFITADLSTDNPTVNKGLTMGTTIKSIVVTSPTLGKNLGPGRVMTLTGEAYDGPNGTGNLVLTTPATWTWSVNTTAGGTLSASTGNPVTFTGKSVAARVTTRVTAKELESNIIGTANVVTVPVGLANGVWAKFHGNARNQGVAGGGPAVTATPALVSGWANTAAAAQVVFSSPIVAPDGTVYVGAYDGNLYAFRSNGSLKWRFRTGGAIESSALISKDGTIYIGSSDKKLYALQDAGSSANLIWSYEANGPIFGSPAIDSNGYLYFAAADPDTRLICVDSLNGQPKRVGNAPWIFTASAGIQTAPALNVAEDTVYVGDVNGNAYAINTTDATARWSYASGSTIYSSSLSLATVGGKTTVFFGTVEGKLHAVDAATGALAWADAVDTEGQLYGTPAISPDGSTVYVATFDNVSGLDRSRVLAYRTVDGSPVWDETAIPAFNPGFTSSPALSNDGSVLYIGCYDGNIYGIDTASGAILWTFNPAPKDSSGNPLTEYFDSSPGVGANGTIYIGGVTGRVYAIK